ncbi:GTPase activating protein, partial [Cladochytrium tenue]
MVLGSFDSGAGTASSPSDMIPGLLSASTTLTISTTSTTSSPVPSPHAAEQLHGHKRPIWAIPNASVRDRTSGLFAVGFLAICITTVPQPVDGNAADQQAPVSFVSADLCWFPKTALESDDIKTLRSAVARNRAARENSDGLFQHLVASNALLAGAPSGLSFSLPLNRLASVSISGAPAAPSLPSRPSPGAASEHTASQATAAPPPLRLRLVPLPFLPSATSDLDTAHATSGVLPDLWVDRDEALCEVRPDSLRRDLARWLAPFGLGLRFAGGVSRSRGNAEALLTVVPLAEATVHDTVNEPRAQRTVISRIGGIGFGLAAALVGAETAGAITRTAAKRINEGISVASAAAQSTTPDEWHACFDDRGVLLGTPADMRRRIFRRWHAMLADPATAANSLPLRRQDTADFSENPAGAHPHPGDERDDLDNAGRLRDRRAKIDKDVARVDQSIPFFALALPPATALDSSAASTSASATVAEARRDALRRMLAAHALLDPDLGYVQGMADVAAALLAALDGPECDAFFAFTEMMQTMKPNFTRDQSGMRTQLHRLRLLVRLLDPELSDHLDRIDASNLFCCFRWLLLLFRREFTFDDAMRLWE